MKNKINKNKCLVYITSLNERTKEIARYCFEKLDYQNIVVDNEDVSFYKKLDKFRLYCVDNLQNFDLVIRSDADRLVYEGLDDLVESTIKDKHVLCSEGLYYDGLMKRLRGGTPVIYKKELIDAFKNIIVPNSKKPESDFISLFTNKRRDKSWKTYNIVTNLHDFEQYPSKVCNVIINRINRGHGDLFNFNDPDIHEIAIHAIKFYNENKMNNMGNDDCFKYNDFNFLNSKVEPINNLEKVYKKHHDIFSKIKKNN